MSNDRLFGLYKYPSDNPDIEAGRKEMQKICDDGDMKWIPRFRQRDMLERLGAGWHPKASAGNCQIISTAYLFLRDSTKGYPQVGRRLFKYWCFQNDKKVKMSEISGKTFSVEEIQEWKKWKKSLRNSKPESIKNQNESDGDESKEYQQFIENYFINAKGKSITAIVNNFWEN